MDRQELIDKLQGFKNACYERDYIYSDLSFDEAYPGIIPTSFIVNVIAKKSWSYSNISEALDKLIDILWKTTESKTRENIFTLNMLTIDDLVNSERTRDREQAATNPDLTPEQIKHLYYDPKLSVQYKISNHIQSGKLTVQQIINLLATEDEIIKSLLIKRYSNDDKFKELILSNEELKAVFVSLII